MANKEKTSVEQAYEMIRTKIAKGELCPGKRISQRKLAGEIGCSQVPVAEAMRLLESDGLLVKEPLKMARVRKLSLRDIEGLYLIREGLEAIAARLCAQRITDSEIVELQELGQKLTKAVCGQSGDDFNLLDMEIHRFIFRCARCPILEEELERLLLLECTAAYGTEIPQKDMFLHRHQALIEAISDRDSDLSEYLAKKHVASGFEARLNTANEKFIPSSRPNATSSREDFVRMHRSNPSNTSQRM